MPRSTDRRRAMPTGARAERPRCTHSGRSVDVAQPDERLLGLGQSLSSSGVERRPICTQSDNWLRMSLSLPRASSTASM